MMTQTLKRRWHVRMAPEDYNAMSYLQRVYTFSAQKGAIKFALVRLATKEDISKTFMARCLRIKESTIGMLQKSLNVGKEELQLKQWSCWMSDEEFALVDEIAVKWGFTHRSEACRFALRVIAEVDGFRTADGSW